MAQRAPAANGLSSTMHQPKRDEGPGGDLILRAIAMFKAVKAVVFIAAGCAALGMLTPTLSAAIADWTDALADSPRTGTIHELLERAVDWIAAATPNRLKLVALLAFAYAALFSAEGLGLWYRRRWAEYLTIVATASLIPFEIYELALSVHVLKVLALLVNVVVVIYLARRLQLARGQAAVVRGVTGKAA